MKRWRRELKSMRDLLMLAKVAFFEKNLSSSPSDIVTSWPTVWIPDFHKIGIDRVLKEKFEI